MKSRGLSAAAVLLVTMHAGVAHAGAVSPMPVSLTFPNTGTGSQSPSQNVQLTNTSMVPVNIDTIVIGGANPNDFTIVNPPGLPIGIGPGAALGVDVAFTPTAGGARSGSLQVQVRGEMTITTVALTGTGVGPKVTVTPSPLVAGGVLFGQQVPPLSAKVGNSGGAQVKVSAVTIQGADAAKFSLVGLPNFPVAVGPNQGFSFQIQYAPVAAGQAMAVLVVTSDDPNTPSLMTPLTAYTGDPKIALDVGTVLFGNQRVGIPSAPQDVNITNAGFSDLHVASIGVAGANPGDFKLSNLPALPATIKVGGSAKFTVTFTPAAAGARAAGVQIASDDPKTATRTMSVSGVGTTPMAMVSPLMVDFGPVRVNGKGTQSVTIKNSGTGPVQVTGLSFAGADAASFSASLAAPFTVTAGSTTIVQLSFSPAKVASFSATLNLTTDDPNLGMASVMLKGSSTSPMMVVDPLSLDFGSTTNVGETSPGKSFTLKNTGNQTLTIQNLSVSGGGLAVFTVSPMPKLPLLIAAGVTQTFTVTYTPNSALGDTAEVSISADDPMNMNATVQLAGTGAEANIATSPDPDNGPLDFQSVIVGAVSKPQGIKISNNGNATLKIAAIKITDMMTMASTDVFAVDAPAPFTIAASASKTLQVTFVPKAVGTFMATLEIDSDDAALPTPQFILIGSAIQPMVVATTDAADNSIDFGQVAQNTPSMAMAIKLHNLASQPQPVKVAASSSQFVPDQSMVTVPANGNMTVNVIFTPDSVNMFAGKVQFTLPGSNTALAMVAVKGEGISDMNMGTTRDGTCAVGRGRPAGMSALVMLIALGLLVRRRRHIER